MKREEMAEAISQNRGQQITKATADCGAYMYRTFKSTNLTVIISLERQNMDSPEAV